MAKADKAANEANPKGITAVLIRSFRDMTTSS